MPLRTARDKDINQKGRKHKQQTQGERVGVRGGTRAPAHRGSECPDQKDKGTANISEAAHLCVPDEIQHFVLVSGCLAFLVLQCDCSPL